MARRSFVLNTTQAAAGARSLSAAVASPAARQLRSHELEIYSFFHFTGNTRQYRAQIANISGAAASIKVTLADGETMTQIYTSKVDMVNGVALRGDYTIAAVPRGNYDVPLVVKGKDAPGPRRTGCADIDFKLRK